MRALKKCFDWRVFVGLVAIGVVALAVAPQLTLSVLVPLLLVGACPLALLWLWQRSAALPAMLPSPEPRANGLAETMVPTSIRPGQPRR